MPYHHQPLESYHEITDKVRSGEYFRESRFMYDVEVHDPMAERYFFMLITALSAIILITAIIAMDSLYPLQIQAPFVYRISDPAEDLPHIEPLRTSVTDDVNYVVVRYIVQSYVMRREEYDIAYLGRNANSVKSQSSNEVYKEYEQSMDSSNPESPVILYQRHSRRKIEIDSVRTIPDQPDEMEVVYYATVESRTETKKTRWQANITFSYNGVEIDDNGKPKPLSFLVTRYRTKRLQDIE